MSHPPGTIGYVPDFEVVSPFRPAGDQPEAIAGLVAGLERGDRYQTLLGITGSGKTATIAWTIEAVQRPTLIIEPNKSLAAQLAAELKEFFPHNRVEYFVSYYDYYQPEAYVPSSDTYIEKDSSINDEIDRLRHACTSSLLLRPDTIVVASVSCIYGLGSPDEYRDRIVALQPGRGARPARPAQAPGRPPVLAQRRDPHPRAVPGPRRHRRDPPRLREPRRPDRVLRRHRRADPALRRADRRDRRRARGAGRLRQHPLRHRRRAACAGPCSSIEAELRAAAGRARGRRQAARGPATPHADRVRPRDAGRDGGVQRGGELQPAPRRPGPGRGALHPARLLPEGLPGRPRREPRGRPPAPGPVRRRPVAEGDPGRPRLPPAVGHGQPAAPVRGVHRAHRPDHPAVGHPGPVGARAQRQRGRAGHPAHRAGRPRGRHPAHHRADRRPAGADRGHRGRRATGCW